MVSILRQTVCAQFICICRRVNTLNPHRIPLPAMRQLWILSLLFVALECSKVPATPCVNIFQYYHDGQEYKGHLQITPPQDYAQINFTVHFLIRNTRLKSDFYGKLHLKEDVDELAGRLAEDDFSPIQFSIDFPIQNPLPILSLLTVNNQTVCYNNLGKLIGIYSTFYMPYYIHFAVTDFSNGFQPNFAPTGHMKTESPIPDTQRIQTPATTRNPCPPSNQNVAAVQKFPPQQTAQIEPSRPMTPIYDQSQCGTTTGGADQRNEWPWLVAIFQYNFPEIKFKCPGTLVSPKHVITTASCLSDDQNLKIPNTNLIVIVGKYDLLNLNEKHSTIQEVKKIDFFNDENKNVDVVDLAIITFFESVIINDYVRPICVSLNDTLAKQDIMVLGWGRPAYEINEPKLTPKLVKVDTPQKCTEPRTADYGEDICANLKFSSKTLLCKYDVGGGLYAKMSADRVRWYIRGVVNFFRIDERSSCCTQRDKIRFTNAADYSTMDWIRFQIKKG